MFQWRARTWIAGSGCLIFVASQLIAADKRPVVADILIEGGTLYDGTGSPGVFGDVAIKDDRIVAVGKFKVAKSTTLQRIVAKGMAVTPGFIDLHNHSDVHGENKQPAILAPAARANLNFLFQGVTTIVTGNCGSGPVDVDGFLKSVDKQVGTNVAHLIPHNDLRRQVIGEANRAPTSLELVKMKELVATGMAQGAWGMSTGLYYTPGSFAKLDELVELSKMVAVHNGIYTSHIRDEGYQLKESVEEAIEIGRQAKTPVHISHLKADRFAVWGKGIDAIGWIDAARKSGLQVTADQYPYTAASTSLGAELIPPKFREGAREDWLKRLEDPKVNAQLRREMKTILADYEGGKQIWIAAYAKQPKYQGKDLISLAKENGKDVFDLVLDIERNGGAEAIYFCMSEKDVRHIMKQPYVATISDGHAQAPSNTFSHPRSFGAFPRKVRHYSIDEKLVSLPFAIRSATGLAADIIHLTDRGYLRQGYFADVLVFDPKTFRDEADYTHPHAYAKGVVHLFVNGVPVIKMSKYTGALVGRALRHPTPLIR